MCRKAAASPLTYEHAILIFCLAFGTLALSGEFVACALALSSSWGTHRNADEILVLPNANSKCSVTPDPNDSRFCVTLFNSQFSCGKELCPYGLAVFTDGSTRAEPFAKPLCVNSAGKRILASTGLFTHQFTKYRLVCLDGSATCVPMPSPKNLSSCDMFWQTFQKAIVAGSAVDVSSKFKIELVSHSDEHIWGQMCGFCFYTYEFVIALALTAAFYGGLWIYEILTFRVIQKTFTALTGYGCCCASDVAPKDETYQDKASPWDGFKKCLFFRLALDFNSYMSTRMDTSNRKIVKAALSACCCRAVCEFFCKILSLLLMYPIRWILEVLFALNMAIFVEDELYSSAIVTAIVLSMTTAAYNAFIKVLFYIAFRRSTNVNNIGHFKHSLSLYILFIIGAVLSTVALGFSIQGLRDEERGWYSYVIPAFKVIITAWDFWQIIFEHGLLTELCWKASRCACDLHAIWCKLKEKDSWDLIIFPMVELTDKLSSTVQRQVRLEDVGRTEEEKV